MRPATDRISVGPRLLEQNMLCSIAIRWDENNLLEVAFIPLDALYERNEHRIFTVRMRPAWPVGKQSKLTLGEIKAYNEYGTDSIEAVDMFEFWLRSILKHDKKIYPMCWSWSLIAPVIQSWLGKTLFKEAFRDESRDLSTIMGYLSDRYEAWSEPGIFNPMSYSGMLKVFKLKLEKSTDPLEQANVNAQAYKAALRVFFPGYG